MFCFGVDIGGSSVKLGLFDSEGVLIDKAEFPSRKEEAGGYIIGDLCEKINELLIRRRLLNKDIIGIGVGVPGAVRENGVVDGCVNLGWGQVRPAEEIFKRLNIKAVCLNDANAAALGELWKGAAESLEALFL